MMKNRLHLLLLSCAAVSMVQTGNAHNILCFRSTFMETCNSYIATINRLQTTEKVPTLPGISGDDLIITALRKVALQFQDLRLRHDLLTGFTFNGSDNAHTAENIALQKLFIDASKKLNDMADSLESITIHGWEIAMICFPKELAQELRSDLAAVAALNGQFSLVLNEAITQIIDPYLAACESTDR